MKDIRVAFCCLYKTNAGAIIKALQTKDIIEIKYVTFNNDTIDPAVNFVIIIFDQDPKDYDTIMTDNYPDWRKDKIFNCFCQEVTNIHDTFPNAKIIIVDCIKMTLHDLAIDSIEDDDDDEDNNEFDQADNDYNKLLWKQLDREKEVLQEVRDKFFKTDYCIPKKFSLPATQQESLAEEIANELIKNISR